MQTVASIVEALGGRLVLFVDWRGGELDRLLDADHALLQQRWAAKKEAAGRYASAQEVTYNRFGDRGSIDDVAFDPATGTMIVSELKSGIYDLQRTLGKLDEKVRVAPSVAGDLGWTPRRVVRCLVMADTRTNRRRVLEHQELFRRFDCRGRLASAWLADPTAPIGGLLVFLPLSNVRHMHGRRAGRQRVRHPKRAPSVDRGGCAPDCRPREPNARRAHV